MFYSIIRIIIYTTIIVCAIYGFGKIKENLRKQNNETFLNDIHDEENYYDKKEKYISKDISSYKIKDVLSNVKDKLLELQNDVYERTKSINLLLEEFELDKIIDYEQEVITEDIKDTMKLLRNI